MSHTGTFPPLEMTMAAGCISSYDSKKDCEEMIDLSSQSFLISCISLRCSGRIRRILFRGLQLSY